MTGSGSLPPWSQISHLSDNSPLPLTQKHPVPHNQFLLGIVIPSKNKGPSSLTAVHTRVLQVDLHQAQHSRPVLGHRPVLAQPTNLQCLQVQPINLQCLLAQPTNLLCLQVQPHISFLQTSLSLPHCQLLCTHQAAQSGGPAGATRVSPASSTTT